MKKKPLPPKNGKKKGLITQAQRRMALLILNTAFFTFLYFALNELIFPYLMTLIYTVGGGALAIWYVIYNRGFRTHGKTPDMLPDELPYAEREAIIADGENRFAKTRWVLLILVPLLFALIFDMIYLFLIPEG